MVFLGLLELFEARKPKEVAIITEDRRYRQFGRETKGKRYIHVIG